MAAALDARSLPAAQQRRPPDRFRTLVKVVASAAPVILVLIVLVLLLQALPSIRRFGLGFLTGTTWDPVSETFGALPALVGTVTSAFFALAIALPVGIAVAIVLAEQGQRGIRGLLGTAIELLAAIPSVVYGIWALYVMAPWTYLHLELPISDRFGFVGWLANPSPGASSPRRWCSRS